MKNNLNLKIQIWQIHNFLFIKLYDYFYLIGIFISTLHFQYVIKTIKLNKHQVHQKLNEFFNF